MAPDEKIEITLKLKVYRANWGKFQSCVPKYIERLEKFINDTGSEVLELPEDAKVGEEVNFEIF